MRVFVFIFCVLRAALVGADGFPQTVIDAELRAARETIRVNYESLMPGESLVVEYLGMPVIIYRRSAREISYLERNDRSALADAESQNLKLSLDKAYFTSANYVWARLLWVDQPSIEQMVGRSVERDILIVGAWSPLSGCVVRTLPKKTREMSDQVFYDACSGYSYDAAGRAIKRDALAIGEDESLGFNLYIPPHEFVAKNVVLLGVTGSKDIPELDVSEFQKYDGLSPNEALLVACRYNDLLGVKSAILGGADVNYYAAGKGTPIDSAILGGSIEIIDILLNKGAKPTARSMQLAQLVGRSKVAAIFASKL